MKSREEILANIANDLNGNDKKYVIYVNGNEIIAQWKWMDGVFFSPSSITDAVKVYKFIVTLLDGGKWKELDIASETSKGFSLLGGLTFSKSGFIGHMKKKSFDLRFGKNRGEDGIKLQKTIFDTDLIKKPIRDYLKQCGWKKKGIF